jgi:hypothetical protein
MNHTTFVNLLITELENQEIGSIDLNKIKGVALRLADEEDENTISNCDWGKEDILTAVFDDFTPEGMEDVDRDQVTGLDDEDIKKVIATLEKEFDANIGINWYIISSAIRRLLEDEQITLRFEAFPKKKEHK